jgi:biotin carboxyl carrier protein
MKLYFNSEKNEYELLINRRENSISVRGKEYSIDMQELGFGRYSLIVNNKSYNLMHNVNDKYHYLTVDNNYFILTMEDEHERKIREMFKNVKKSQKDQVVKAAIPGLVVKIMAAQGELVEEGTPLLILEAMKMENIIKAACACRVQKILVREKDTVQINQALIRLEVK